MFNIIIQDWTTNQKKHLTSVSVMDNLLLAELESMTGFMRTKSAKDIKMQNGEIIAVNPKTITQEIVIVNLED